MPLLRSSNATYPIGRVVRFSGGERIILGPAREVAEGVYEYACGIKKLPLREKLVPPPKQPVPPPPPRFEAFLLPSPTSWLARMRSLWRS